MNWTVYRTAGEEPVYEAVLSWGGYIVEHCPKDPVPDPKMRIEGVPKWTGPWKVTVRYVPSNGDTRVRVYILGWVSTVAMAWACAKRHLLKAQD